MVCGPFLSKKHMACTEIGQLRNQVCAVLHRNVESWHYDLQRRYGDPRVYEAQREEMLKEEARALHGQTRQTSELLQEAYAVQAEKNRGTHDARIKEQIVAQAAPPQSRKGRSRTVRSRS